MIALAERPLTEHRVEAILRPVDADWSAVTPEMRRLEVAAGEGWSERCAALGELPLSSAVITDAGALPARYVIHVAIRSSDEPVSRRTIESGLRNGLRRAGEWGIVEVALPVLGTGPGNLTPEEACAAMRPPLLEFVEGEPGRRSVWIRARDAAERAAAEGSLVEPGKH